MTDPLSTGANRFAAVIYNPTKVSLGKLRTSVEEAASAAGWGETQWFSTTAEDSGQMVARMALRQGASVVIAAGGDGTVRAVSEALRGSGVSLGIVPTGTGNLLARNLQLPLASTDDAAAIAFAESERAIDVGVASMTGKDGATEDHVFLVMAGLGLDAEMIANTRSDLKKQVGWLAYVDAGVRVIPKSKPFRIRYTLAGRAEKHAQIDTILIANCGMLPGNMQLLPEARIDDGILDIAVLRPKGLFGWLQIWRRVTWENGVLRRSSMGRQMIRLTRASNERTMTTMTGPDIHIVADDAQAFELDGDEFGAVRSVYLRADAGSLIVRVPAPSPLKPTAARP